MRIYLIGYMASGKTNLGRELAALAGMPFLDLDELFEERFRVSIFEFFGKYGEELFRKLEREILQDTVSTGHAVISTGGGTPCFFDNMDFLLEHGRVVYLRLPVRELARRLAGIRKKRPLLTGIPQGGLELHIAEQLKEREMHYLRAHVIADGPGFDVEAILRQLQPA